jgi:hypothetical protein
MTETVCQPKRRKKTTTKKDSGISKRTIASQFARPRVHHNQERDTKRTEWPNDPKTTNAKDHNAKDNVRTGQRAIFQV